MAIPPVLPANQTIPSTLGTHILAEFYECDSVILDDQELIQKIMLDAAHAVGATIITSAFHKFAPQGVTGVVVISESHLTIHTWPEYKYAAVDVFTCGTKCGPQKGVFYLEHALKAKRITAKKVLRGILSTFELRREAHIHVHNIQRQILPPVD